MRALLIDSWAWIEYFRGTPEGGLVKQLIQGRELLSSILTLAEIANWCERESLEPAYYIQSVKNLSGIIPLDEEIAETAGRMLTRLRQTSPGIGMIDALIYTQAAASRTELLTGDPHFKNLHGVIYIGE